MLTLCLLDTFALPGDSLAKGATESVFSRLLGHLLTCTHKHVQSILTCSCSEWDIV